ncbi:MAG: hypothetical protein INQ03_26035 [Candidatus Heimdallarchaeota archaeon]|nr:hypothetical protein [Candidatus Heimdallarchaeota archaeon]
MDEENSRKRKLDIPSNGIGIFTKRLSLYFTGLKYRIPALVINTKTRDKKTKEDNNLIE